MIDQVGWLVPIRTATQVLGSIGVVMNLIYLSTTFAASNVDISASSLAILYTSNIILLLLTMIGLSLQQRRHSTVIVQMPLRQRLAYWISITLQEPMWSRIVSFLQVVLSIYTLYEGVIFFLDVPTGSNTMHAVWPSPHFSRVLSAAMVVCYLYVFRDRSDSNTGKSSRRGGRCG